MAKKSGGTPNDWLVQEMYDQFKEDPSALSPSWQTFFEDYEPVDKAAPTPVEVSVTAEKSEAVATVKTDPPEHAEPKKLRGVAAKIAQNMEVSLTVPTATSVRAVPAKLLEVNRRIINNYLMRVRGGKVSFTHLIAFAILRALDAVPSMRKTYDLIDDVAHMTPRTFVGLGLAVDMEKSDGSRTLIVPCIKTADTLTFDEFHRAYEELIRKVRTNKLEPSDFEDVTMTLTNPGMIGTVQSVPRLMTGQSVIVGVGSIEYPAEFQASDPRMLAKIGVGKTITITSTYDHRVIQGAESGAYLKRIHELLLGEDGFYDEIFKSLEIPYAPALWRTDQAADLSEHALMAKQVKVNKLLNMYRVRGHLIADLDPLDRSRLEMHDELDPTTYGLSIWDLEREFVVDGIAGHDRMQLGDILGVLRDAYCRTVGIEYMHIQEPEEKTWIQERVEGVGTTLKADEYKHILQSLNRAEAFEKFLQTKYVGQKRFSLEGAESTIPLLDAILEASADDGLEHVVLGMAHRGRLNVLANIIGKSYREIFDEFEGNVDRDSFQGSGDVKYHLGQRGTYESPAGNTLTVELPPNPSHLEAVDPVVEGMVRAMQDAVNDPGSFSILPLLIHGDAAFAGQGVVAETLNFSQLRGYRTGGTVHVVINNQVGFTTAPEYSRSSVYCTDVAKMVQAPIFHVNGDDPSACLRVARLAVAYRQEFNKDVVIDLVCYRRWGHNEADDPMLTLPRMYKMIDKRRSVRKIYTERLVKRGEITVEEAEELLQDFEDELERAFKETSDAKPAEAVETHAVAVHDPFAKIETGADREVLDRVIDQLTAVPDGFSLYPKLERILTRYQQGYKEKGEVPWPVAETLAYGSILLDGISIRLAGEDCRRGTFSHRHAVYVDQETEEDFAPLAALSPDQGTFMAYDSLLSEFAALGFEYGYSVVAPEKLVIWEAQFGDFVNGAQTIIDQFISAAEDKWGQESGLVMFLPHGFEGQGPEHSSARMERFLTLCAENNMQAVNATTAAQFFHLLRRQAHRTHKKPLVVFTPKSLLRAKQSVSIIDDFVTGSFQEVLDDPFVADAAAVSRVALCSGKVAYDAMAKRDESGFPVAIVRVEQLYPWPADQITEIIDRYPNATEVMWLQDEPANMGAWPFAYGRLASAMGDRQLTSATRAESGSPATGSHLVHEREQAELLAAVVAS